MPIRPGFLAVAMVVLLLLAGLAVPAGAGEHLAERAGDRGLGRSTAPIVMIEYYSLDCAHCAAFHADVFPKLKTEFIDTGKVRFVFRDFPLSWAALKAAIMTHCAPPERYFDVQEALLRSGEQWSKAEETLKAVSKIGAAQGVPEAAFKACLDERVLEQQVFESQKFAREVLGVKATPTFIINNDKLEGNIPFDKLSDGLTNMLKEITRQSDKITRLEIPIQAE
ncbi:MAG: DsbA family protein [Proteobacteria bacterium]|nr:DsbA family protein [Pseudomonadota bacterium]MDA1354745.1 DsbA family protein [Pseudomonadota bacterium]